MNKKDLIEAVSSKGIPAKDCEDVINKTFEELSKILHVGQGVTLENIGVLDMHYKKSPVTPNQDKNNALATENLSIFFHPSSALKARLKKTISDESENRS